MVSTAQQRCFEVYRGRSVMWEWEALISSPRNKLFSYLPDRRRPARGWFGGRWHTPSPSGAPVLIPAAQCVPSFSFSRNTSVCAFPAEIPAHPALLGVSRSIHLLRRVGSLRWWFRPPVHHNPLLRTAQTGPESASYLHRVIVASVSHHPGLSGFSSIHPPPGSRV